jgi:uncharacterized membrane protein
LLVAWVSLDKNQLLSAVAMGLAVATKQTAWFFLPFYLILLWRKSGIRSLALMTSIIAGIFILMNVYFIIKGPTLWLSSLASPMTDPMFPIGMGIVSMVTNGIVNIRSSLPFAIVEAFVFAGCTVCYIRNATRYPLAGPILAVLQLFFAWRSILDYFFYVQIIIIACMLTVKDDASLSAKGINSKDINKRQLN